MALVKRPDMATDNDNVTEAEVVKEESVAPADAGPEGEASTPAEESAPAEAAPAPATSESKEVAPTPARTTPAAAAQQFQQEAAEEGYEGLELGYGSFPVVKLDSGVFVDGDGNELGTKLEFTPMATRSVYAYSQAGEDDGDVFFSYDDVTTTKGEPISEILQEWKDDGFEAKKDVRLEVTAQLIESGDIVMLSLPPTARRKFSGQMAVLRARRVPFSEAVIIAEVGKPVKSGNKTFRPWTFRIAN